MFRTFVTDVRIVKQTVGDLLTEFTPSPPSAFRWSSTYADARSWRSSRLGDDVRLLLLVFNAMWQQAGDHLGPASQGTAAVDGKGLLVSRYTSDPQARKGYARGGMHYGDKLHAITDARGRFVAACVRSLNRSEMPVACELIPQAAERLPAGTTIAGDKGYTAQSLYTTATDCGLLFLAPFREPDEPANRANPQPRQDAFARLQTAEGRQVLRDRTQIERVFARFSGISYGDKELPSWIRGLKRVSRHIACKIAIYHSHLILTAK